jgi:ATP-dependent Clp protease ATP-binding subunit ClpC
MIAHFQASIELAVQEAQSFKHHYIGTEHLLPGLIREDDEITGQIFRKSGVMLEKAGALIKQILAGQATIEPDQERQAEPSCTNRW